MKLPIFLLASAKWQRLLSGFSGLHIEIDVLHELGTRRNCVICFVWASDISKMLIPICSQFFPTKIQHIDFVLFHILYAKVVIMPFVRRYIIVFRRIELRFCTNLSAETYSFHYHFRRIEQIDFQ